MSFHTVENMWAIVVWIGNRWKKRRNNQIKPRHSSYIQIFIVSIHESGCMVLITCQCAWGFPVCGNWQKHVTGVSTNGLYAKYIFGHLVNAVKIALRANAFSYGFVLFYFRTGMEGNGLCIIWYNNKNNNNIEKN